MAPEEIEWVKRYDRFAELATDWDALASTEPTPFGRHSWFDCWWRAFGPDGEPAICVVWSDERLAAALPLFRQGRRLTALVNTHSPVFAPPARDRGALRLAARAALAMGWRELVLPALPEDGEALDVLRTAASDMGRPSVLERDQTSPIVDIRGEWEAYRAEMRSKWSSAERKARKMWREHDAQFDIVIPPDDLAERLRRGFLVEGSGWKARAGTAILSRRETNEFYTRVAHAFAATNQLRLSEIRLDGQTVAFDLCLLDRSRLYLLKTGYDESYHHLSPGLVLRKEVVQRCFELGLEAHELLGDVSEWKSRFATSARAHVRMRSYPSSPTGLARCAYRRRLRPLLRDLRNRGRR